MEEAMLEGLVEAFNKGYCVDIALIKLTAGRLL